RTLCVGTHWPRPRQAFGLILWITAGTHDLALTPVIAFNVFTGGPPAPWPPSLLTLNPSVWWVNPWSRFVCVCVCVCVGGGAAVVLHCQAWGRSKSLHIKTGGPSLPIRHCTTPPQGPIPSYSQPQCPRLCPARPLPQIPGQCSEMPEPSKTDGASPEERILPLAKLRPL
ncbi:hypothetical protein AAFF_G00231380, partial [Aldrovandia affinis]